MADLDAAKYLTDDERRKRRYGKTEKVQQTASERENVRQADIVSAAQTQRENDAKRAGMDLSDRPNMTAAEAIANVKARGGSVGGGE